MRPAAAISLAYAMKHAIDEPTQAFVAWLDSVEFFPPTRPGHVRCITGSMTVVEHHTLSAQHKRSQGVVAGRAPGDACVLWSFPIVPWMSDGSMVIWDGR